MASDISNYIQSQLEKGLSRDQVKQILLEIQWQENDINNAFIELDQELKKLEEAKKFAPPSPIKDTTSKTKLDHLGNTVEIKSGEETIVEKYQTTLSPLAMIGEAYKFYLLKFPNFINFALLYFLFDYGIDFVLDSNYYQTTIDSYIPFFTIFIKIFQFIILVKLFALIALNFFDKEGIFHKKRRLNDLAYLEIIFLQAIVAISLVAIMLLFFNLCSENSGQLKVTMLIIIAYVFFIWFSFSTFAFLEKDIPLIEVLATVSSLIRNKWSFIITRSFVLTFLCTLLYLLLYVPFLMIFGEEISKFIFAILYDFLILPFFISYHFLLYHQLQSNFNKKEIYHPHSLKNMALICSLGIAIIAGLLIWKGRGNSIGGFIIKANFYQLPTDKISFIKLFLE